VGEIGNVSHILIGKFQGKGSVRRPRYRWKDNVKMDLIIVLSIDMGGQHLLAPRIQTTVGSSVLLPSCYDPQNEALVISITAAHVELKVIDQCPSKFGTDIMPSALGLLAAGYPRLPLSLADRDSRAPTSCPSWTRPATGPQPSPRFPPEAASS
jgi:hypothetical protein